MPTPARNRDGTFRTARPRANPTPYPKVALRRYRGAVIRHPEGGDYEVQWGTGVQRFRTLAGVKAFVDRQRAELASRYDTPARRKNPAPKPIVYRGETIHRDGPAYLVPGIRWGDGTGAVPRFLTLAAAKKFVDRHVGRNPAKKETRTTAEVLPAHTAATRRGLFQRRKPKLDAETQRFLDRDAEEIARRNPSKKAAPSHDLFGERTHRLDIFGDKSYVAKPEPKKTPAERKREAKRRAGQTSFDVGLTRGLFG